MKELFEHFGQPTRRDYMFIGHFRALDFNPEGIICIIPTLLTYNPFGIK
jgi:hypothetical protein